MKENKYTELDKYIQSKLSDDHADENGWNVPSMSVLDGALDSMTSPNIEPNETIANTSIFANFRNWFILLILLLGIAGAAWFVTKDDQNTQQISAVEQTNTQAQTSRAATKEIPTTTFQETTKVAAETKPLVTIEEAKTGKTDKPKANKQQVKTNKITNKTKASTSNADTSIKPTTTKINRANVIASLPNEEKATTPINKNLLNKNNTNILAFVANEIQEEPAENVLLKAKEETKNLSQARKHIVINMLSNIPQEIVSNLDNKLNINHQQLVEPNKPSQKSGQYFVEAGYSLSSLTMKNMEGQAFELTEYDQFYSGYSIGIGYQQILNDKLELIYDASYNRINNHSLYQAEMAYDEQNSYTNDEGELMYKAAFEVESPMGGFNEEVAFRLEDNATADGEMLNNKTHISEVYQIVQSSAALKYNFLGNNRIQLYAKAGLGANYLLAIDQQMDAKVYRDGTMMMNKEIEHTLEDNINRFFVSATVGTGFSFQISDHISTGIELGYQKALSNLREAPSNGDAKTYLNTINVSAQMNYMF